MFFDGDFKQRRPINLGGRSVTSSSAPVSRLEILRKAEEERQKREFHRRRLQATLRIQAFYRSLLALRSWTKLERELFTSSIQVYQTKCVSFVSPEEWIRLCRSLVFFYKPQLDTDRLYLLVTVSNLETLASQFQSHSFLFHKLVFHVFSSLQHFSLLENETMISFILSLVKMQPSLIRSPSLMRPFQLYLTSLLNKLPSSSSLLFTFPTSLQETLTLSIPKPLPSLFIIMASTHPSSFLKDIMSLSNLLMLFTPSILLFLRKNFPLTSVLQSNPFKDVDLSTSLISPTVFLSNFITLTSSQLSQQPSTLALPYFQLLYSFFKLLPDSESSFLKHLFEQDAFLCLLHCVPFVPLEAMSVLCHILALFLIHLPLSRSPFGLLSDTSSLLSTLYHQCIEPELDNSSAPSKLIKNEAYMSALFVVSDLLYRSIATLTELEFSDWQLLTNMQLLQFITQLKSMVFHILYHSWPTPSSHLKTMVSLLQQLYSTRAFQTLCGSSSYWLVPDINVEAFFNQVLYESDTVMEEEAPLTPLQRILTELPFVIPFQYRVRIFRHYVSMDKLYTFSRDSMSPQSLRYEIRRDHLFEDSFNKFHGLGSTMKKKIAIVFVSSFGVEEEGIDGGGVFKEFLNELAKNAFHPSFELFELNHENELYPSMNGSTKLKYYEFLGLVLGKALYEGILLVPVFAPFFLNKWVGKQNFLDDLIYLDPELYKNLLFLKKCEDVESLSLNFTITFQERGQMKTVELLPNGKNIQVDNTNKIKYIYLVADFKLNALIQPQSNALLAGMSKMINLTWLTMFTQEELGILISGSRCSLDLEDMKTNTVYSGGYFEEHPLILSFWKVVSDMSDEDKRALLCFITSCTRAPLLGFKELNPLICIRSAGDDQERLPTSSTCINLLKLPEYQSEELLKKKLLYSIRSKAGFELS